MSGKQKAESKKRKVESVKSKVKGKKEEALDLYKNQPVIPTVPITSNDSFDFGGLPERNLKKNLGCG